MSVYFCFLTLKRYCIPVTVVVYVGIEAKMLLSWDFFVQIAFFRDDGITICK